MSLVVGAAMAGMLTCQQVAGAPRLCDCIEAPYAYLVLDAQASGAHQINSQQSNPQQSNPQQSAVQRLLADPALDAVFGRGNEPSGALSLVRGMVRRGAGEIELAMTGILDRQGQPLLVLRARLQRDEAQRLRLMFDAESGVAEPLRRVGERQTYCLRDPQHPRQAGAEPGPGEVLEMVLCGDDLVAGNDGSAVREVLMALDDRATAAAGTRRVLSADARFQGLRRRANVQPGSLLVYGDWKRLGRRLESTLRGAPAHLLGSSGLGSARAVMLTLSPATSSSSSSSSSAAAAAGGELSASLQFDFGPPGRADAVTFEDRGPQGVRMLHELGIDGWFAATESVEAKSLVRELPRGGLGGMVLSVDLASIASASPRSSHLVWDLREAFEHFGLDFDRNVLGRLGRRGTMQVSFGTLAEAVGGQMVGGVEASAGVSLAWSLRASSRKAAGELFSDLRRVAEAEQLGRLLECKDGRGKRVDVLQLGGEAHEFAAYVTLANDSLMIAEDRATLVQVLDDSRSSRPRRRDQLVTSALQTLGDETVAGLFDLDLDPLFAHVATVLPGVDLSALPRRHVGIVDIDSDRAASIHTDGDGGAVVRIRVVSSR